MSLKVRPKFLVIALVAGGLGLAVILLVLPPARVIKDFAGPNIIPLTPAAQEYVNQESASQADSPFYKESLQLSPKKGPPRPGDWLVNHGKDELPQSFEKYVLQRPPRPTTERGVFVIQPLGEFNSEEMDVLKSVAEYCGIFFALPVRVEQPMPLPLAGKRTRDIDGFKFDQYHTTAILENTLTPNLPKDAACYMGVTMSDLYPEPAWNFVFGMADVRKRVGVQSLARYRPEFWGDEPGPDSQQMLLLRAIKVMVHEAGHMFGLLHCAEYECVMNGSNNLDELDRQLVFLDPVCLRKLQWNIGFDPAERYKKMEQFWRSRGYTEQADWVKKRLEMATQQTSDATNADRRVLPK